MAQLSPLRRRMIEDMTVRNMSPATQRSYVSAVSKFGRYFGKSPERLSLEDVRAFQVHLVSTGISWPGLNQIVCALRFFYGVTLGEAAVPERIRHPDHPGSARPQQSVVDGALHAGRDPYDPRHPKPVRSSESGSHSSQLSARGRERAWRSPRGR